MEMVEERKDELVSEETKVCGGKYTIVEFCAKFWIQVTDIPAPSPGDIVRANKKIMDLFWSATREKARAQKAGLKSDISILNTVLANLDFARKVLHSMVWARSLEVRVGSES